ncbi:hypothetical protein Tco_1322181, partial [Tanacetum coccineum]
LRGDMPEEAGHGSGDMSSNTNGE